MISRRCTIHQLLGTLMIFMSCSSVVRLAMDDQVREFIQIAARVVRPRNTNRLEVAPLPPQLCPLKNLPTSTSYPQSTLQNDVKRTKPRHSAPPPL